MEKEYSYSIGEDLGDKIEIIHCGTVTADSEFTVICYLETIFKINAKNYTIVVTEL